MNARRQLTRAVLAVYLVVFLGVVLTLRVLTVVFLVARLRRIAAAVRRIRGGRPRVLYLACFFPGNAGFEQRVRRWCLELTQAGLHVRWRQAMEGDLFGRLLGAGHVARFQLRFALVRLWQCLLAVTADAVVVQRELLVYNDYGGVFLERFLLALNGRVALDFDDDIGAAKGEPNRPTLFARLMFASGRKFAETLRLYPFFIAGSRHLADLVPPGHGRSVVVPTCVDVERYGRKVYGDPPESITFGWIGGINNLRYLDAVVPALNAIAAERRCRLLVISGRPYECDGPLHVENRSWSYTTESRDLLDVDVGLMPLPDSRVARGKCGYKLLQYMACGLVTAASAVGVNTEIVDDGVNGFLVHHHNEWVTVLRRLLREWSRFADVGRLARQRVEDRYSFNALRAHYVHFIRSMAE
jgi:glycosyltransferase involved in cell wall biosynthesis